MEYSIHDLAQLAGISSRTLRWYDEKDLLKPCRVGENGYRYYGAAEVDRLQDILLLRELGLSLAQIRSCVNDPAYDRAAMLERHCRALKEERERLTRLIAMVEDTMDTMKGEKIMSDREKFEALKKRAVEENEAKYGKELRAKYGDAEIDAGNAAVLNATPEQYAEWKALEEQILTGLAAAVKGGLSAESGAAQEIVKKHARWLTIAMGSYDAARHRGIAELYVCDERFAAYYDRETEGCAQFLRDAVAFWAGK